MTLPNYVYIVVLLILLKYTEFKAAYCRRQRHPMHMTVTQMTKAVPAMIIMTTSAATKAKDAEQFDNCMHLIYGIFLKQSY